MGYVENIRKKGLATDQQIVDRVRERLARLEKFDAKKVLDPKQSDDLFVLRQLNNLSFRDEFVSIRVKTIYAHLQKVKFKRPLNSKEFNVHFLLESILYGTTERDD